MNKKNILKIGIVLIIIGMIFVTMQNVQATSFDANQFVGEDGSDSSLNTVTPTPTNTVTNNSTLNQITNNTTNNTVKNNTVNNTNKTTLPKTGANENIIIGLMVVFTAISIYTFKKVRDYNM